MIRIITYILFSIFGVICNTTAQVSSEEILLLNEGFELPGSLTSVSAKSPLIIWVHGSGNVDRNGNQTGVNIKANYIKQLRDSLNKNNISFFSYDKRTANPKNAVLLNEGVLFEDFVSDVKKVVAHFKKDQRFNQIILIGHSQGSLVGLLASENTTKYISLAGPSKSMDEAIVRQLSSQNPSLGLVTKSHFTELKETGTIKEIDPMLVTLFSKPNLPFLKSWMAFDPPSPTPGRTAAAGVDQGGAGGHPGPLGGRPRAPRMSSTVDDMVAHTTSEVPSATNELVGIHWE